MAAPRGNQFWKKRSKHGRDKIFTSPEILWQAACEYFNWCDKNPWYKVEQCKTPAKAFKDDEGKVHFPPNVEHIPTARPYTIQGLCFHLHVNTHYFNDFKNNLPADEKDFSDIIHTIEEVIYRQKFEGAAVGAFQHNIIARDLGLREKTDAEITGKGGGPIETKFDVTLNL